MPRFPDDYGKGGQTLMLDDIADELAATRWETGLDVLEPLVLTAMATVPREAFVPEDARYLAFRNGPVGLNHALQTLKLIEKHVDGGISSRNVLTVAFVPLTRNLRDD